MRATTLPAIDPATDIDLVELAHTGASVDLADRQDYGAPLDRLFGEDGIVFVTGTLDPAFSASAAAQVSDPLVQITRRTDGAKARHVALPSAQAAA